MARANGIPAKDVYEIDASKQTTTHERQRQRLRRTRCASRSMTICLRRGSPEEIQAVMGHEMGHYVMNHIYKDLDFFSDL